MGAAILVIVLNNFLFLTKLIFSRLYHHFQVFLVCTRAKKCKLWLHTKIFYYIIILHINLVQSSAVNDSLGHHSPFHICLCCHLCLFSSNQGS